MTPTRTLERFDRTLRMRARFAAASAAAAALVEFGFDLGFAVARGTQIDPGYIALCGALMAAAGLACAALGSVLPGAGVRITLTAWVVVHAFADPVFLHDRGGDVLVLALVTALLVPWRRMTVSRAATSGTAVGTGLCVSLLLSGYVVGAMPPEIAAHGREAAQLLFVCVLLVALAWEPLRRRITSLPSFGITAALALALTLIGTSLAFAHLRPQSVALARPPHVGAAGSRPDVIVLVLDTVRADHLSTYGYERDTTPNLQRFLAEHPEAEQYDLAFSTASWTVPAHASLLTGTLPSVHHARSSGKRERWVQSATRTMVMVADETLAEVMHSAGYCTVAVVANANLLRVDGLQRGFDAFFQPHAIRPFMLVGQDLRRRFFPGSFEGRIKPYPSAAAISERLLEVAQECAPRPVFALANFMEAHAPFVAPAPHAGIFAGDEHPSLGLSDAVLTDNEADVALKRDRYDEGLHYLDAQLRDLFTQLEASGEMSRAWLIITADHGEAFCEHGTSSHGSSIYNEQVRIPLIVKPPQGMRLPEIRGAVSLLDVTATIAALAGREAFGVGRDLRQPAAPDRGVAIEFRGGFRNNEAAYGATSDDPSRAVVRGSWKLIERAGRYELYDLSEDPNEAKDRGAEHHEIVSALASALPHVPDDNGHDGVPGGPPAGQPLGRDEQATLRALGYVE